MKGNDGEQMNKSFVLWALSQYGISPLKYTIFKQSKRERNRIVWKVETDKGNYALKQIELNKAKKIAAISRHLMKKGVPTIPVIPTLIDHYVIEREDLGLVLFPWIEGKKIRYETEGAIERISELLAHYHEGLKGFTPDGIELGDFGLDLKGHYKKDLKKLESVYREFSAIEAPVAKLFCRHYLWFKKRAVWALKELPNTAYRELAEKAKRESIIGHGDFSCANILSNEKGEWRILDLDSSHISLPIWDLSRLISWMNNDLRSWDYERFQLILKCYRNIRPLSAEEEKLLAIDQCFPHQVLTLLDRYYKQHRMHTLVEELESLVSAENQKLLDLSIDVR